MFSDTFEPMGSNLQMFSQESIFFGGICPSLNPQRECAEESQSPRWQDWRGTQTEKQWLSVGHVCLEISTRLETGSLERRMATASRSGDSWPRSPLGRSRRSSTAYKRTTLCTCLPSRAQGLIPILFATWEKWHNTQQETPHLPHLLASKTDKMVRGCVTEAAEWKILSWNPDLETKDLKPCGLSFGECAGEKASGCGQSTEILDHTLGCRPTRDSRQVAGAVAPVGDALGHPAITSVIASTVFRSCA